MKMTLLEALILTRSKWRYISRGGKIKEWARYHEIESMVYHCPICEWNVGRPCELCPLSKSNWCISSWATIFPVKGEQTKESIREFWKQPEDDRTRRKDAVDLVKILTKLIEECQYNESRSK